MASDPIKDSPSQELLDAQIQFVVEWGRMSSSWGINRTMAQIHALLLITGDSFTVEELMERLHISRGNASMNLRDLMDWGIIRRTRRPGDRKDTYESQGDILSMFARVIRERKRREIDPTVAAIQECLKSVPENDDSEAAQTLRDRMGVLLELFGLVDRLYQQLLVSDSSFRDTFRRLSGGSQWTDWSQSEAESDH